MPSFKSVDELNKHLATRSYVTGYSFSNDDKAALGELKSLPNAKSHAHAYRWAIHILALTGNSAQFLGGAAAPSSAAPAAKAAADDDVGDMFGDDDDEDGETAEEKAANKARKARMEAARKLKEEADAKAGKVKKAKEVEKSLVVLEIKPWEADTDLEMVWNKIREYKQEGLTWGETFKLEPVAFGIKKLVMTATIVDSLVLMDDITENIEALEDYVQSVQVASMNKI
jgi:elongation factor 1-beta